MCIFPTGLTILVTTYHMAYNVLIFNVLRPKKTLPHGYHRLPQTL